MALGLNHFYVTVDAATYGHLEASDFLRAEFGVYEKRTTVRKDITYSGIYFYGRNTYFEFFAEGTRQAGPASGLALGVDEAGENIAGSATMAKGATSTTTVDEGQTSPPYPAPPL